MKTKLFILVVGSVLLVACVGDQAPVDDAPAAEEAAPEEQAEVEEETAETVPVTDASMLVGGTWFNGSRQGVYVQFNDDGTYVAGFDKESLPDAPDMHGTYEFQDGQFVIVDAGYSDLLSARDRCPEIIGRYTGEIRDNGRLYFEAVEDECEPRYRSLTSILGHARLDG